MLHLERRITALNKLPPPLDERGFYTADLMAQVIGRPPRWTDGSSLQLLGWKRTVRKVNGITKRVWFPPERQT